MKNFFLAKFLLIIVIVISSYLCTCQEVLGKDVHGKDLYDQITSTSTPEEIFKELLKLNADLPPSILNCRTGGSLTEIFYKTPTFKNEGNSFLVDKDSQSIALFEKLTTNDIYETDKIISARVLILVSGIKKEQIVQLLLPPRDVVTSNQAQVYFIVNVTTKEGSKTYVNELRDENGNPITATVKVGVRKLGHVKDEKGNKFIAIDAFAIVQLPKPPRERLPNGSLISVFDESPGLVNCAGRKIPVHDFDLTDLKNAYGDPKLVEDIIKEAEGANLDNELARILP